MRIKQGDRLPDLVINLTDNGQPLDLTGATVRVIGVQGVTEVFNDTAPTIDDPTTGQVVHIWVAGETNTVGRIFINAICSWSGQEQTFPPYGSLAVDIEADELESA